MAPADVDVGDAPRWEHAPCGLLMTDGDGLILRANATFCAWLGLDADRLHGTRRLQDLLTMGGRIFHQTHWAPLLKLQGSLAEVKLELAMAGRGPLPVVMNALRRETPHGVRHDIALFVATDRHAYERELLEARRRAETLAAEQRAAREALRVAETRLRLALEAGNLHVYEVDPATGERHFDPGFGRLMGLPPETPATHRRLLELAHPEDGPAALAAFDRMLADPSIGYRAAYRVRGEDGVARVILSTARALRDDDGAILRIVGVAQDITELAARREAAEDRALFAEQLVGIVSHDLRTPMSTIAMGSEALLLMGGDARVAEIGQRIRRAAARARRLADDLLDFTRARLGRGLDVAIAPIDLHRVVGELVADLRTAHPRRTLVHETSGQGVASADANRLSQLVGNLVGNAIAYGDPASPVTVRTGTDADRWTVSVHNDGPPIAPELLPKLFLPMVRGDSRTGSSSVGLGLYIVDRIAAAHGGTIEARSEHGHGTTFTACVPHA